MKIKEIILNFWFGETDSKGEPRTDRNKIWYGKSEAFDREIKEKFEEDVERALSGEYDDWVETPKGCLALVILLDQFTRNIYRDTPKAFSGDKKAVETALFAIDRALDGKLGKSERQFLYMPLMHSEHMHVQEKSLKYFKKLFANEPTKYADSHYELIKKYGRFPHRNKILGRESTHEELEYLSGPDAEF